MNAPVMSPQLRRELQRYYDWATTGAPDGDPYSRRYGLCANAPTGVQVELSDLLWDEFGERSEYPFGGMGEYYRRSRERTQHQNPELLAWLRRGLEIEAAS